MQSAAVSGGGRRLGFEPTSAMAFVGAEPASWANAAVVVDAARAERLPGTDLLPQKPGWWVCA